ncbi:MAG: hypothetical protein K6G04_06820 [Lachnospiraceae bacterium]|nr:hypothetical protein [Lachnospiraceae bacterium]
MDIRRITKEDLANLIDIDELRDFLEDKVDVVTDFGKSIMKYRKKGAAKPMNTKKVIKTIVTIVGIVAIIAGIAYAVYKYMNPSYKDEFDDDFDDAFDDDDEDLFDEK